MDDEGQDASRIGLQNERYEFDEQSQTTNKVILFFDIGRWWLLDDRLGAIQPNARLLQFDFGFANGVEVGL